MTYFIVGNTAVENARSLTHSALPNAPQVHDEPAPRRTIPVRARLSAVLRSAAERDSASPTASTPTPPAADSLPIELEGCPLRFSGGNPMPFS